jgi:DNA mismatch repair protein MutS
VFLRQLVAGGSSRSYGIDVARLAGLPAPVISRARLILRELEGEKALGHGPQLSLFHPAASQSAADAPPQPDRVDPIRARLAAMDPDRTTPLEALALLAELVSSL